MKTTFLRVLFLSAMLISYLGVLAQSGKTQLSVTGCVPQKAKVYDGGPTIAGFDSKGTLVGVNPGDDVSFSASASYLDKNAGTNKTIKVVFTIYGMDKAKYQKPADMYFYDGVINPKLVSVSELPIYPAWKYYDGNTSVHKDFEAEITGVISPDAVYPVSTLTYDGKDVSDARYVTISFSLEGADADNYIAPASQDAEGYIKPRPITVINTLLASKVYDGNTECVVTNSGTLPDTALLAGDSLPFYAVAEFKDVNAANNKSVYVRYVTSGPNINNYTIKDDSVSYKASITKRPLTATTTVFVSKPYDQNNYANFDFDQRSVGNKISSDTGIVVNAFATYDNPEVGTGKTITVTYTHFGTNSNNYTAPVDSLIYVGVITKRSTTVTGTYVPGTKVYDGTDTAHVVNPGTLDPTSVFSTDTVTLVAVAHYNDSSAGDNKYITIVYHFVGPDSAKYEPPHDTIITNCVITPKTLRIGNKAKVDDSKVYDGYTDIHVAQEATIADPIGTDEVYLVGDAQFDNPRKGEDKRVTVTYTVTGPAAANYAAPNPTLDTADITPRRLTIQTPTVRDSKEYDGRTDCEVTSIGTLTNVVGNDTVFVRATANYDNKNVGNNKNVYVTYSMNGGSHAANYIEPLPDTVSGKAITPVKAIVTGTAIDTSKVYDGTDTVKVIAHGTIDGVHPDSAWVVATARFDNKSVGRNKTVIITYTLAGPLKNNYTTPDNAILTASINPRTIYFSADATADTAKVYDGYTRFTVKTPPVFRPGDVIDGDDVSVRTQAEFLDSKAGDSKDVKITYTLWGTASTNYILAKEVSWAFADIKKLQLEAIQTDVALTKVYDGTPHANVRYPGILTNAFGVDSISLSVIALYDSATVGQNKTISVIYSISGKGKDNYFAPVSDTLNQCRITKADLNVTGTTASEKDYDGNTSVVISNIGTLNGVFDSDVYFVIDTLKTYYNKNADAEFNKTITVNYTLMGGANKDNYNPIPANTIYADILPKQLYVTGTTLDSPKTYDGGVTVNVTDPGQLIGLVGTDAVNLSATAVTSTPTVDNNKSVTITYAISGAKSGNYNDPAKGYGNIAVLPADLTVVGTKVDTIKGFDGTRTARISLMGTLQGRKGSDNIAVTATANYDDENVGTGKTITVDYKVVGSDSINYGTPASTTFQNCVITLVQPTVVNTVCETSKVYDGNTDAVVIDPGKLVGIDPADTADVRLSATASYDNKNTGNRTITITYSLYGTKARNYGAPAPKQINGFITSRGVKASGAQLKQSKVYDATTAVEVVDSGKLDYNVLSGDIVYPVAKAVFRDKNVGTNKWANVTYTIEGPDSANYYITNTADSALSSISRAPLGVTGTNVQLSKNYDGNRNAIVVSAGVFTNAMAGDDLNLSAVALYDNQFAGTNKTITVSYTVTGGDSANYFTPAQTYFNTGEITAVKPTVSGYQIKTQKVYDGLATVDTIYNAGSLAGVDPSLTVYVSTVANYSDKNVGSNKDITLTFNLYGQDAKNFTTPDPITLVGVGTITPKTIVASNATVLPYKTYDGTTSATVASTGRLTGVISPDSVIPVAVAAYRDKNVDTTKIVDIRYSLTGKDAGNYTLDNQYGTTTASITAASLTVAGTTVYPRKDYDGNTSATVIETGSIVNPISGDQVILNPTATYDNKNVGTSKTITVNFTLSGSDARNYLNPQPAIFTNGEISQIKPRVINTVVDSTKTYNGNTIATVRQNGVLDGALDTTVTVVATAQFSDKNAGSGKDITITYTLRGNNASNYQAPDPVTLAGAGTITAKSLVASNATVLPYKTYDGTTSATVTNNGRLTGVISPDSVAPVAVAAYRDKNVDTTKIVDVVYTLTGPDASNYTLDNPYGVTFADITPASLSVVGTAVTPRKNYDGNTSASVVDNGNIVGVLGTDQVILNNPTATYDNKNVGTSKTITVNYTLSGSDAVNYVTPQPAIFTNGEISQIKPRVINTVVDSTKTYNGNTIAVVTDNGTLEGVLDPDVTVVAVANYDDKNAGARKNITITYSLQGASAANYQTPDPVILTQAGLILQKDITASGAFVAMQKPYDGNTDVAVLYNGVLTGVVMPDSVGHSVVASFLDKNAGVNKTVALEYSIFGPDANNYRLVNIYDTTSSTIVPKNVNVIGAVVENVRDYDGTTNCNILSHGVIDSLCVGDVVTVTAYATFDNKNVDSAKVITVDYILHGVDSINYVVSNQTILTNGQITPIQLVASGLVVDEWKIYDGNTIANILQSPILANMIPGDVLYLSASAEFDTPDAGRGKTITTHYNVWGTDCRNYYQIPDIEYSNNGIIFDKVEVASDTTYGLEYKIVTDNLNYCGGEDATLLYVLDKGEPVEYRIEFSNAAKAEGFVDIDWTTMPLDIVVNIPDSCDGGLYYATLQFRNAIQKRDGITNTARDTFAIQVNMSNRYIVDIFEDVVSIDNREEIFHSYQWYKNGQEIADATLPYYQDLGGLEGEYYVVVNIGEPTEAVICSKTFHNRVSQISRTISAYPNPAESDLNIQLTGFSDEIHQLMMVNASGYIVVNDKFSGDSYQFNVGSLPSGTYTVFVDGESVKVIKK